MQEFPIVYLSVKGELMWTQAHTDTYRHTEIHTQRHTCTYKICYCHAIELKTHCVSLKYTDGFEESQSITTISRITSFVFVVETLFVRK